jgi:hypothetical protein
MKALLSDCILLSRSHLIGAADADLVETLKKARENPAQIAALATAMTDVEEFRHLAASISLIEIGRITGPVGRGHNPANSTSVSQPETLATAQMTRRASPRLRCGRWAQ